MIHTFAVVALAELAKTTLFHALLGATQLSS